MAYGSFGDVLDPMAIVPPGVDNGIRRRCVANVRQRIPPGIVYGRGVASSRGIAPPQWLQECEHQHSAKQALYDYRVPPGSPVPQASDPGAQSVDSDRTGEAKWGTQQQ